MLFGPSHRALVERIRAISRGRPIRLLDVGCGTGLFASVVRSVLPAVKVVAIDLVAEMLAEGRLRWHSQGDGVLPVQGDSERLPFSGASFDIVTCANSFHHYPRQERAIAEMRRVLKPGGRLMIIDGYRDNLWGWFIYDVCVAGVEGEVRHASAARFRELMTQSGLQAIAQRVHSGLAPFLMTEGIATEPIPVIPAPHFRFRDPVASEHSVA
jgi:ubiquinone/menaquinone biosynthesis C-methylase UbiE